jgi:hypothetical protein
VVAAVPVVLAPPEAAAAVQVGRAPPAIAGVGRAVVRGRRAAEAVARLEVARAPPGAEAAGRPGIGPALRGVEEAARRDAGLLAPRVVVPADRVPPELAGAVLQDGGLAPREAALAWAGREPLEAGAAVRPALGRPEA